MVKSALSIFIAAESERSANELIETKEEKCLSSLSIYYHRYYFHPCHILLSSPHSDSQN